MRPLANWLSPAVRTAREHGLRAALFDLYYPPLVKSMQLLGPLFGDSEGESIYEHDWDLLIVLDACRADLMQEVLEANEYPFVRSIATTTSTGSMTPEWIAGNFRSSFAAEMATTNYVCGNPFSDRDLDCSAFGAVQEVWRYAWDETTGTLPPRAVTDEAIRQHRQGWNGRLLVHYMQPHSPFLTAPELSNGKSLESWPRTPDGDVWTRLGRGEVAPDDVWRHYRENLELVLEDVELLCENVDAERAILTSDHGNGFGEWGIYGHPGGIPCAALREVPWLELDVRDEGTYDPGERERESTGLDVEDRLESLGYV